CRSNEAIVVRTRCKLSRVFDQISRDSFERLLVLFERISREIELLFKETLVSFFLTLFSWAKRFSFQRFQKTLSESKKN
ncbi:hypothetical protein GIB67_018484, partial [Kingdonia uniflora]